MPTPSVAGYGGTSAESTVLLASQELQQQIRSQAPALWKRIEIRRDYMEKELGIQLSPHVLPMASTVAYLRPLMLAKEMAMAVKSF